MQPKKLEQYKYFQPIAWTVCLSFAAYVGMLALNLKSEVTRLESSTLSFEYRLEALEQSVGTTTKKQPQR